MNKSIGIVSLLLIQIFTFHVRAINVTFTYENGQNSCGQSHLIIKIQNNSSAPISPVNTEFKLSSSMSFDSVWSNTPTGSFNVLIANNLKYIFNNPVAAGATIEIHARLNSSISCAQINCSELVKISDTLIVNQTGSIDTFVNQSFLRSPCISYDEADFVNRLQSATVGDTITRSFILRNTGAGIFNGRITILDQYRSNVDVYSISTNSTDVITSSISSASSGDSSFTFSARFNDVRSTETIQITEKVIVKKCIENDEGKSDIFIDWGCGNSTCQQINPYPISAQVLKDFKNPNLEIQPVISFSDHCIDTLTHYRIKVKNAGDSRAINLNGSIKSNERNTYSRIVASSVVFSDTSGMTLLASMYQSQPLLFPPDSEKAPQFQRSCMPAGYLNGFNFSFSKLVQSDSFYVDFDVVSCCPGADTTNMELPFDDYTLEIKYNNVCLNNLQTAASARIGNATLSWNQLYEPLITDMAGDPALSRDTSTFEINNKGISTEFYKLNVGTSSFQVVLKTDTGLAYVANDKWKSLHISSPYGLTLYPSSIIKKTGGLAEGYQDTIIVATFAFPDTFRLNTDFFKRYFRNSSVFFNLRAYCPASEPLTRFTQEIYFNPDSNCASNCNNLLHTVTYNIAVHCPGCITPGWVADSMSVRRMNFGERDDDNDRLPDFPVHTLPDKSKLKLNRYTIGDTIYTDFHAYIVDGDPGPGKSKAQLENNGPESFKFKYCYLNSFISDGKVYELLNLKVHITDAVGNALNNGQDSIILPTHTVKKIGDSNDSLPGANFFYSLDLDTLYKYGLNPNYEYDIFDQIRIVSQFKILDPADFYLTPVPDEKDPWLLFEKSDFRIQNFRSLIYLTGQRDLFGNGDVDAGDIAQQDPNLLDSTMIYWCESYGGVGNLIGRSANISVSLPTKVSCLATGSISLQIDPGSGSFQNPFPFEYRKFVSIDSIQFQIPNGFLLVDTLLASKIEKPADDGVEYDPCEYSDSVFITALRGNVFTIYPDSSFSTPNTFQGNECPKKLIAGDEKQGASFAFGIRSNCQVLSAPFYSPTVFYTTYPDKKHRTYEVDNETIQAEFAEHELTPKTLSNVLNKPKYCYDITLESKNGNDAPNTFIKVVNLSGKLSPEGLYLKENPSVFYLPDSTGLFRLDTIQGTTLNQYQLCLTNRCDDDFVKDAKDSIDIYYGFDCDQYPNNALSNICQKKMITHIFTAPSVQIQPGIEGPNKITMCDNFELKTTINITDIGTISNLLVNLVKSDLNGIYYKSGTVELIHVLTNTSAGVLPIPHDIFDSHIINLDSSLKILSPDGFTYEDQIIIRLGMYTNCKYDSTTFRYLIQGVTSSCDTINGDTLSYTPNYFFNYPVPEVLSMSARGSNITNLGGTVTVTLPIVNNGSTPTANNHLIELPLDSGYTYNSMSTGPAPTSISDSLLTWSINRVLAAGGKDSISVILNYPTADNCDTVFGDVRLIQRYFTVCDTVRCFIQEDTFQYHLKSICTPCPPNLSIGDTCKGVPIFNQLNWTNNQADYCIVDTLFYKIYFASDVEALNFTHILNTTDSLFRHIDLNSFDGCYYITAVGKDSVEGPPSIQVCNTTCVEDFICDDLFISNLITLNDDNKNDFFTIRGAYTKLRVEIYNRWGDLVYLSEDYKNNFSGSDLESGVYYYSVTAGNDKYCNGWLHILK